MDQFDWSKKTIQLDELIQWTERKQKGNDADCMNETRRPITPMNIQFP